MKELEVPYHTLQTEALMRFLDENYCFRRNIFNDEVEYINKQNDHGWKPLRKYDQNSITLRALRSGIEAWYKDVKRYVESMEVKSYNPLTEYLERLPSWDHRNRIGALARRVPTDNAYWESDFHLWFRAMVAQWMQCNPEHGNTLTPLLIGRQGDGKSTYCRLLLPPELRTYYTDRIDFTNRNEAVLSLRRFALINVDEYDSISSRQNAFLKHILQKADLKVRRSYSSVMEQHQRYASFIATTNDQQPLTDPSGSRRFLCIETTGSIDLKRPINYPQLYAQAVAEIHAGKPTYFNRRQEQRIQRSNQPYQRIDLLEEQLNSMYRIPADTETTKRMSVLHILKELHRQNPLVNVNHGNAIRLGLILRKCGFRRHRCKDNNIYDVAIRDE